VNELKSRGDDVEVVTAMPNHLLGFVDTEYQGKLYVKEVCDGVPVHRTWVYAARGTGVKRLLNYISFMLSCWLGLVRIEKPDYIFIESPPLFLALPGLIASRIYGTRTILNISDLWPDSVKELGVISNGPVIALATKFENWAYKRASVVNAVTEGILTRLAVAKGVPREKLLLLPNGVDTTLFSPRPKDVKLEQSLGLQGRRVVLYAGTHGIAQGLETLIEAAKLLWNSNITFLFVGDGSAKPALRDQAARLQLDNVMFVEPRPLIEMPGYYSLAFSSIVPLLNIKLFASARLLSFCPPSLVAYP
jgi:glycosyltransferase involved in cell wall biosynthesis